MPVSVGVSPRVENRQIKPVYCFLWAAERPCYSTEKKIILYRTDWAWEYNTVFKIRGNAVIGRWEWTLIFDELGWEGVGLLNLVVIKFGYESWSDFTHGVCPSELVLISLESYFKCWRLQNKQNLLCIFFLFLFDHWKSEQLWLSLLKVKVIYYKRDKSDW